MLLSLYLYPCIFLLILLPEPTDEAYGYSTSIRQKKKIEALIRELYADSVQKIKSVNHVKRSHYRNPVFQTGELIFDIRAKHKRMLFLYDLSESQNMSTKIKNVIECEQINLHIDKMVHMIEENEWTLLKRSETHEKFKLKLRTREEDEEKKEKQRETLRSQMEKIKKNQNKVKQKQKHMDYGFDSD